MGRFRFAFEAPFFENTPNGLSILNIWGWPNMAVLAPLATVFATSNAAEPRRLILKLSLDRPLDYWSADFGFGLREYMEP